MLRFITEAAASGKNANAEMAQSVGGVLTIAALGLLVVFAVLVLLMGVIKLMGALVREKKPAQAESSTGPAAPTEQAAPAASTEPAVPAPGSCGEVKLFDVPDKTAAMLMAITADKLGEPLNTLRFISIKEVK